MMRGRLRQLRRGVALAFTSGLVAFVSCRPALPVPAGTGGVTPAVAADTAPARAADTAVAAPPGVRLRPEELVPPPLAREFRGVWVASVANIDWPSRRTLSTAESQAELRTVLDRAVLLKLNAVILQVRPAADALYASKIEPWSEYLTGTQGRAPVPFWDPLEFAVREAHARGLELHAWFNPYRAKHFDAKSPLAATHIANTAPALVKKYGAYLWMDPGEERVRARTLEVILDVVKRYDVDGVHIDDYFYPYQERDRAGKLIDFPDEPSWRRYVSSGGTLTRSDWRRRNVDLLVESLYAGIHQTKPWVKFGISPFGIWRPGYPAQIRGLDAYSTLYADARKWLREGWLDYFTPQLYWPTTRVEQSYPVLLSWWASENVQGRHLWPGNYTSRSGGTGSSAWPVSELVEQIRVTRAQPGATGNVHFSMKPFLTNQAGMNDSLVAGPYTKLALVPASPWLRVAPPPVPVLAFADTAGRLQLRLSHRGPDAPWQWVVHARVDTGWVTTVLSGAARQLQFAPGTRLASVSVTALNRAGVASAPVSLAMGPLRRADPAHGGVAR